MTRRRLDTLPRAQEAGILSQDPGFRAFVARQLQRPDQVTAEAAAEFIRRSCRVKSRRDLDTDSTAATRFAALRTDFDAWRGRIPQPRN